ncbi:hypothetical protein SAY86_032214 [Trapa natans]|uniref:Uncharacterized protein n=1 Tax=Trapa natans TaxID=22666 RepID=A0AAN7LSN3_TRANT|nr:hypothetical protein SAY86_032214 [Trapa natans]
MGRAPCCDKANVKRGPWSPEEDSKLKDYIEKYGTGGNWISLPQKAGLRRCGKSCRLRWLNYLRPNIKHGEFSGEEDRVILDLFATIGSRWSVIASQLPGRTDNDIKNYWNTKLKKKLMGAAAINLNNPSHRIVGSSPSSSSPLAFPCSNMNFHLQESPLLSSVSHSQTLPSSFLHSDSFCFPFAPFTRPSLLSGIDLALSVPQITPQADNHYSHTLPLPLIQAHEGNVTDPGPAEVLQYHRHCGQNQMISKQERVDDDDNRFQGFMSAAEGHHHQALWGEKRNDGYYGESNVSGSTSAMDYDLEEVNRLIGSNSNSGSDHGSFLSSLY